MKKVYFILGLAAVVISVCMIYLVFKGVSLRTEPIIKPSPIDAKYENITYGVMHRMFPHFQAADYVVWGLTPNNLEEENIFQRLQAEYEFQFKAKPIILQIGPVTTADEVKSCKKPCWLLVEKEMASELPLNQTLMKIRKSLGENYFSITISEFEKDAKVPEECEKEQRLEQACVLPTSVREARRFMKDDKVRYFFLRRYNERDHFLFLQRAG